MKTSHIPRRSVNSECGSATVAGVLLAVGTMFAMLCLIEFSRIDVARSELESGLRLSEHAAMAGFDEELFSDFGLYAVTDEEEAFERGVRSFETTMIARRPGLLAYYPEDFEIRALPDAILANPAEMKAQILNAMRLRAPMMLLERLTAKWQVLRSLGDSVGPLKQKLQYEKLKAGVQGALEKADKLLVGFAQPSPGKEPEVWRTVEPLDKDIDVLVSGIARTINIGGAGGENGGEDVGNVDQSIYDREYRGAVKYYREKKRALEEEKSKAVRCSEALDTANDKMSALGGAYESWYQALLGMREDSVTQNLRADFTASAPPADSAEIRDFSGEVRTASEVIQSQSDSWSGLSVGGTPFEEMKASDWIELIGRKRTNESEEAYLKRIRDSFDPVHDSGYRFSEKGVEVQKRIASSSETRRSGLMEFIDGWMKRRSRLSAAKRAARLGLENTAPSLSECGLTAEQAAVFDSMLAGSTAVDRSEPSIWGADATVDYAGVSWDEATELLGQLPVFSSPVETAQIVAYWYDAFSHRLSGLRAQKDPSSRLSIFGADRTGRPTSGAELEYILYGNDEAMKNIRTAQRRITALRFLANSVYAFTSADLYWETLSTACAIAGWTGFGVPIVHSGLLLILAIGETYLDMQELLAGEDVPIYKSPTDWKFSLGGTANIARQVTGDIFDRAEDELFAVIEGGEQAFAESMDKIRESAVATVTDAIRAPIDRWAQSSALFFETMDKEALEASFDQMIASIPATGDGAIGRAIQQGTALLVSRRDEIIQAVLEVRNQASSGMFGASECMKRLEEKIDEIVAPITDGASAAVSATCDTWKGKWKDFRSGAEKTVNKTTDRWLSGFRADLGGGDRGAEAASGSGLTMNYEEYLLLFLVMHSATEQGMNEMLSRTARLIHVNVEADLTLAPCGLEAFGSVRVPIFRLGAYSEELSGGVTLEAKDKRRYVERREP